MLYITKIIIISLEFYLGHILFHDMRARGLNQCEQYREAAIMEFIYHVVVLL